MTDVQPRPKPSRRAIVGGAAWAVPAVALAVPAPAVAASTKLSVSLIGPEWNPCDTTGTPVWVSFTFAVQLDAGGPLSPGLPLDVAITVDKDACWTGDWKSSELVPSSGSLPVSAVSTGTLVNDGDIVKIQVYLGVLDYCCNNVAGKVHVTVSAPGITPISFTA